MKYNYKDSNIEWIGQIPKHWKIDRIKDVSSLRDEKCIIKSEQNNYLELEDIEQGTGRIISFRNTLEVKSAVMYFKRGDVLFGKLRPYLEKYFYTERDGYCTGEILAIEPIKVDGKFLKHFISSPNFIKRCNNEAYGAKMPRVNWSKQIAIFEIPLPPLPEQKTIAAYLDQACARIDRIIEIKERQIKKIKTQRKNRINEVVRFGMVKEASQKTNLEYLPEIKKGWKLDRFKDVALQRTEKTDEKTDVQDYLELEDISQGSGRILNKRDTLEVASKITKFYKGDVLFGKLRPYLEKYLYVDFDGKCTGEILAFEPTRVDGKFLMYILASNWFITLCNSMSYGAKMPRVNWSTQLSRIYLPLPTELEQKEIASHLDQLSKKTFRISSKLKTQIKTLKNYRKSLIHECVTGKKQVYQNEEAATKLEPTN